MAKPLLPDELWERVESVLPKEPPKPKGGRPRVSDRAALTGILFVLKTGTPENVNSSRVSRQIARQRCVQLCQQCTIVCDIDRAPDATVA